MENEEIQITFNRYEQFEQYRQKVCTFLQQVLPNSYTMMEIALNEAVNNALYHTESNTQIKLRLRVINGKKLIIRVIDNGEGFPVDEVLGGTGEDPFEERLFEESGRGLLLMKSIADKVKFNKKGNQVLLMKSMETDQKQCAS